MAQWEINLYAETIKQEPGAPPFGQHETTEDVFWQRVYTTDVWRNV